MALPCLAHPGCRLARWTESHAASARSVRSPKPVSRATRGSVRSCTVASLKYVASGYITKDLVGMEYSGSMCNFECARPANSRSRAALPSATGRDARADFSETEALVRPCRWSTDHLRSLYALVHQARSDVWRKPPQIEARTVTSSICVPGSWAGERDTVRRITTLVAASLGGFDRSIVERLCRCGLRRR